MKRLTAITLFLHSLTLSFGQNAGIKTMVDSLQYLNPHTLNCSADLYWRIIAKGDKVIPFLIDKLTDITSTSISSPCKKTKLNVAEISYEALTEIAYFPMYLMTGIQFDIIHNDCWNFYDYFYKNENKKEFQKMVQDWYLKEKKNYKVKFISKKKLSDCKKKYKITKYYDWSK
jgi:hypothetical protein